MGKSGKVGFGADFRRFFVRGLATLLPTVLTIVVLFKCYEFIQNNISVHITKGVTWQISEAGQIGHLPEALSLLGQDRVAGVPISFIIFISIMVGKGSG